MTANDTDVAAQMRVAEAVLLSHYGVPATECMIEVNALGRQVRIFDTGSDTSGTDRTPLLLLHGISSLSAAGFALLPHLGGRRVIMLDWLSHGLSDPYVVRKKDDLRAHAVTVITAVLDTLGLDIVDLAGHSLGAQFSLYYALAQPQRVRRIVTIGAPGAAFGEVKPPFAFKMLSAPGMGRLILAAPLSMKQFHRNSAALHGPTALEGHPDELAEVGYLSTKLSHRPRSLASYFRRLITPYAMRPGIVISHVELGEVKQPVLVVWGKFDAILSTDAAAPSIASLPDATLFTVVGGHAPWLDKPQECGERIAAFLDEPA